MLRILVIEPVAKEKSDHVLFAPARTGTRQLVAGWNRHTDGHTSDTLPARFLHLSEKRNDFGRRPPRAEVELHLFMAFWFQQKRMHGREHGLCPMDGMATWTTRQHQAHDGFTGYPVMNDD